MQRLLVAALGGLLALASPAGAQTTLYEYVGSWTVGEGPDWGTNPQAMSGRMAAAHLFGGAYSDYAISTLGADVGVINFKAFLDGWGDTRYLYSPADQDFYKTTREDGGYNCGFGGCSYSAFVRDHSSATSSYRNYAFRAVPAPIDTTVTPEPVSMALLGTGLAGLGVVRRRRRKEAGTD